MAKVAAEVGSAANRYQILARLAVGGMAEIYLARGAGVAGIERYCVLKRIIREYARDAEFVAMFLDEARLATQLQHPNIASVYDIGMLGDSYFFTMEYVHGETVRSLLQRAHELRRPVPLACALAIAAGAAAGLHHAHERYASDGRPLGIVHRDVSPSNVMVSYEGNIKLVDFGVAKAADRAVQTRSGTIKGKISYLSPEQCTRSPIDRRSDLFSLGIVVWELLTCARLYRRSSDLEAMNAIVDEDAPAPSARRGGVPRAIDDIVLRLLAKSPADRFQTAAEVVEAIETAAMRAGTLLSASPVSRWVRELFGTRAEPWLEINRDTVPCRRVTLQSTPIPAQLIHAPIDTVELELAEVLDLSASSAYLDLGDDTPEPAAREPSRATRRRRPPTVPRHATPTIAMPELSFARDTEAVMRAAGSRAASVALPTAPPAMPIASSVIALAGPPPSAQVALPVTSSAAHMTRPQARTWPGPGAPPAATHVSAGGLAAAAPAPVTAVAAAARTAQVVAATPTVPMRRTRLAAAGTLAGEIIRASSSSPPASPSLSPPALPGAHSRDWSSSSASRSSVRRLDSSSSSSTSWVRDDEPVASRRPRPLILVGLAVAICVAAAWFVTRPDDHVAAVPARSGASVRGHATSPSPARPDLAASANDAGVANNRDVRGAAGAVRSKSADKAGPRTAVHGPADRNRRHESRATSRESAATSAASQLPSWQAPPSPPPAQPARDAAELHPANHLAATYRQGDFASVVRTCNALETTDDDTIERCLIAACHEHDIDEVERRRPIIARRPRLIESCKQVGNLDIEIWRD